MVANIEESEDGKQISNYTSGSKEEDSTTKKLNNVNKRRRRALIVEDDSDKYCDGEQINNDASGSIEKNSATMKGRPLNKRRRRAIIVEDDTDEDGKENNKKKAKEFGAKPNKRLCVPKDAVVVYDFAKKEYAVEQAIKTATRLGKKLFGKRKIRPEAKQQSFEEQAIHDQKGLSKIIGCKKGKRGIRENHKDPTNVNSASKLSKQTKEKVRKATQRRRKGRSIVFHTEIITNQVLTSKILNSCFL